MATKINLLPQELGAGKEVLKLVKILNRISIIFGTLFLVGAVAGIIYLFTLQTQISSQTNKNNRLEVSIKNLQATEQKLVLVKDRIDKIKSILSQKSGYSHLENIQNLLSGLPPDATFDEANVTSSQIRLSVTSRTSLGMIAFLNNLTSATNYKQIVLKNFNFRPASGYSITVEAN